MNERIFFTEAFVIFFRSLCLLIPQSLLALQLGHSRELRLEDLFLRVQAFQIAFGRFDGNGGLFKIPDDLLKLVARLLRLLLCRFRILKLICSSPEF